MSRNVKEGHGRWFPDTLDLDLGPGFGTGLGLDNNKPLYIYCIFVCIVVNLTFNV